MNTEIRGWIATAILAPICLVTLSWTLVVFHTNRRKWQSKDLIISTLLTQGIIKQMSTFLYALVILLKPIEYFETYCGCVKWLITSIDIFQAATIGTLIFTRLLAVRFPDKFRATVKRTHLYYHLITLGILSSCIGIASILAEKIEVYESENEIKYCTFLPYELNAKYAFLSITLNSMVDVATIVALIWTIYCFLLKKYSHTNSKSGSTPSTIRKSDNSRHVLMTSSSDLSLLSDMTLRSLHNHSDQNHAMRNGDRSEKNTHETNFGYSSSNNGKTHLGRMFESQNYQPNLGSSFQNGENFYGDMSIGKLSSDTLKSSKIMQNYHQLLKNSGSNYDEIYSQNPVNRWASESSYLSTSTSSTNSRAPCLARQPVREENLGLRTTVALFLLCFICTHFPFLLITIVGTFIPNLLPIWPLNAYLLWAGLLQDCLLPILLAAVDRNFKLWLRQIYTRQHKTPLAKHQGLDGKFRVFNTPLHSMQPIQLLHNEPVKFPITNGSLFTSVDGRLPIIHNYRRGQGQRTNGLLSSHCISMGLPAAMRRVEFNARAQDQERKQRINDATYRHATGSFTDVNNSDMRPFDADRRKTGRHNHKLFNENSQRNVHMQDFRISNMDLEPFRSNILERSEFEDSNDFESEPIYATLSSRSCCSATTAANDDFEFYQNDNHEITDAINCSISKNQFEKTKVGESIRQAKENILALSKENCTDGTDNVDEIDQAIQVLESAIQSGVNSQQIGEIVNQNIVTDDFSHNKELSQCENDHLLVEEDEYNNELPVSKIDRCLLRIHDEHLKVLKRTQNIHVPIIHQESDVDSLVLESFNNLKQLHELRNVEENEDVSVGLKKLQRNTSFADQLSESNSETSSEFSIENSLQKMDLNEAREIKLQPFKAIDIDIKNNSNRRLYKKTPLNRRYFEPQLTKRLNTPPTNRRLMKPKRLEKTPPLCRRSLVEVRLQPHQPIGLRREFSSRRNRPKKMLPVLSVDSLSAALSNAGVSYLDNGDLWRHGREIGGSVPDFKKIFVSDFI